MASRAGQKNRTERDGKRRQKANVFHERIGSLTHYQACQLLGDDGARLIRSGAAKFEIQSDQDVYLGGDLFRVRVPDHELADQVAITTITLQSGRKKQLQINCNQCERPCEHLGAAFEFLLTTKSVLGLAMPPDDSVPLENLTEEELFQRAIAERQVRAEQETMTVRTMDRSKPWTDYVVTSRHSGRSYRVALRGLETGDSYCTCPDFRTNHLGTCKHILNVQEKIKKRFTAKQLSKPYRRRQLSVGLAYGPQQGILFYLPHKCDPAVQEMVGEAATRPLLRAEDVLTRIQALEEGGVPIKIYPDAERFVQQQLVQQRVAAECDVIRKDPASHPLRTSLLNATLLPYQMDGIAFAAATGRAILADDMGLGKTI